MKPGAYSFGRNDLGYVQIRRQYNTSDRAESLPPSTYDDLNPYRIAIQLHHIHYQFHSFVLDV